MIQLKNIKKVYVTASGNTVALDGIDLTLADKGMIFINGKSGSGKTTLLNVIGGLDGVTEGEIIIDGKSFSTFTAKEFDSYRNTFIGFIFQEYNLLPDFTIDKNIKLANEIQGAETESGEIEKTLKMVEIDNLSKRMPSEISGGQKQRVAIARALIKKPKVIMADEPTGALDSVTGIQVMDTLKKLSKEKLVIVVSHDLELAEKYADRIITIKDGKIIGDYTCIDKELKDNIIEGENELIVREGAKLTSDELNVLAKAIEERRKINVTAITGIKEKRKTVIENESCAKKEVKLISSKMKFSSSAFLGFKSLTVKPIRLAFTILLAVIAFSVFGVFDTVASFNQGKLIQSAMTKGYNSIGVSATQLYDGEEGYSFKLSQEDIDKYSKATGLRFKGIYDLEDNYAPRNRNMNKSVLLSFKKGLGNTSGANYYSKEVNGLIAFSEAELDRENGLISQGVFNYKLVYGEYPKLENSGQFDVAISTYLAESILAYSKVNGGKFEEKTINSVEDILGVSFISPNYVKFNIVGIVDCGKIPTKFEILKTDDSADIVALKNDFYSFINSAPYQSLFVNENFIANYKAINKRTVMFTSMSGVSEVNEDYDGSEIFYGIDSATKENTLFFNDLLGVDGKEEERWTEDNKLILNDGEVLIHVDSIKKWYKKEMENRKIMDPGKAKEIREALGGVYDSGSSIQMVSHNLRNALTLLKNAMGNAGYTVLNKQISFTKTIEEYSTSVSRTFKVVGFYYDVNTDISYSQLSFCPLLINEKDMTELSIYNNQGFYSRMIAPLKGRAQARALVKLMSTTSGIRLEWFENSVISVVEENAKSVQQFFNLFLYVSLVLALFSIFMLFNYITTSINSKRQTIGILRALGAGGKDIFTMFATESLIIALLNGIFASIVTGLGSILVNFYIRNIMNFTIDFAYFGIRQVLLIFLFSIVTALVSSIMPIIRISKEKPVDLIRKN